MRAFHFLIGIIGTILAGFCIIDGIITIALFAHSKDGSEYSCTTAGVNIDGDDAECRDRTAAVGILAGCVSILVASVLICFFCTANFIGKIHSAPVLHLCSAMAIVFFSIVVAVAYLISWALMAKDIDDFSGESNNTSCETPDAWSAALAFALLGLTTTFSRWPELRAAQVLMPFVSGIATGLLIGRFLRESRALRTTS